MHLHNKCMHAVLLLHSKCMHALCLSVAKPNRLRFVGLGCFFHTALQDTRCVAHTWLLSLQIAFLSLQIAFLSHCRTPAAWNTPGFDHTLYFTVKCVQMGGHKCWTCDWTQMCSGCVVDANEARANWAHFTSSYPVNLVIDWRPDVVARFFDDGQWARVVVSAQAMLAVVIDGSF